MPHSTDSPPGVIATEVNYWLEPPEGQPRPILYPNTAGSRRRKWDSRIVQNGFQVVPFPTVEKAYDDDERIKQSVYPEAEALLKKTVGATKVYIMSHIIRRDSTQKAMDTIKDLPDEAEVRLQQPAMAAHVGAKLSFPLMTPSDFDARVPDQSYTGAQWVLESKMKNGTIAYKPNTRWAIINIWHPIKPVNREPLAVCDASTVLDSDLKAVTSRIRRPKDGGVIEFDAQLWYPIYNPEHKWYWPKRLMPDEALLIKCFDSKQDGRARRTPHSAIVTPDDEGPARESIEIRCMVLWEDEEEK